MKAVVYASDVLLSGGVIAYPTEGVFGLGCLPDDLAAVERILDIKCRDASRGLILIAAEAAQLEGWIDISEGGSLPEPDPACPITWIVPRGPKASPLLCGAHETIAVRLTTNPVARSLCIVSGECGPASGPSEIRDYHSGRILRPRAS